MLLFFHLNAYEMFQVFDHEHKLVSVHLHFIQEYQRIVSKGNCHPDVYVNLGCTYFFLGMYPEADDAAQKGNFWPY